MRTDRLLSRTIPCLSMVSRSHLILSARIIIGWLPTIRSIYPILVCLVLCLTIILLGEPVVYGIPPEKNESFNLYNNEKDCIFDICLFGSRRILCEAFVSDKAFIERYDNYVKQTYRNRCVIAAADGPLALTIPTEKVNP